MPFFYLTGAVGRAGEQIFLGYSVNMFIIRPVSRAGGQMCARVRVCVMINERLRPVPSDAGAEVVALVVKTNTAGWRR